MFYMLYYDTKCGSSHAQAMYTRKNYALRYKTTLHYSNKQKKLHAEATAAECALLARGSHFLVHNDLVRVLAIQWSLTILPTEKT